MRFQHFAATLVITLLILLLGATPGKSQGTITTFAGNGTGTFAGDGGQATSSSLNHPTGLVADAGGAVYIADTDNHRVRRVSGGIISTVAGNGTSGSSGDGGQATNASFADLSSVAVDQAGNLYIADSGNHRVRKVSAGGVVTALAGTGVQGGSGDGGPAVSATLNRPIGVALDYSGNLYICDSSNQNIRRVNLATGIITTYAGNGNAAFSGDNGPAIAASLQFPLGIATDMSGNLFIADAGNNRVRKVNSNGIINTIAGAGAPALNIPSGVIVDAAGTVFFSDSGNNQVRKIDGSGTVSTIAGTGTDGFGGDGGTPTGALLSFPWGLTIDPGANLYVADRANNRIRRISGVSAGALPVPPATSASAPAVPRVTSISPRTATANAQIYTLQIDDANGAQDLDVINLLINRFLDGRQACYLAYSRPGNVLYLVNDTGDGLLPGMLLNGSGTLSNGQCIVTGAGSSASTNGNALTLTLNLSFKSAFSGDRVLFAAGRSLTQNSGWQTVGVLGVPPLPSSFPLPVSVTPNAGSSASTQLSLVYQDATAATNLQTAWALINTALDGRSACYIVYYRPGNQVLLFPDNGDGSQAPSMILTGSNSVSNSQCTVSAQGSSVSTNGNTLTVNLNVSFKPAFAGPKAIWMAVQTNGGAQTSDWRPLGDWVVPGN